MVHRDSCRQESSDAADRIGDGSTAPAPPEAVRIPFERTLWDDARLDHYQWLEDKESPEVRRHLEAENAYTEHVLGPVDDLRETLFAEIKSRIKETDLSVPVIQDQWAYYGRTVEGLAYPIHCRRPVPADVDLAGVELVAWLTDEEPFDEQVLLDENAEAEGRDFFDIGVFEVSPDHRLLLWAYDDAGDERFTAFVRDLETGADRKLDLDDISYGSAWALDNETFFYVRSDAANRPHQIWRHRVGASVDDDTLIFDEPDERFFVGVGRDKDDSFIHIGASSKITDEVWVIPADEPEKPPRVVAERRHGVEYGVSHHGDRFVVLTNDGAENFRVMTAPDDAPGPENWTELVAGHDTVTISDIDVNATFLTLFERVDGITRIRLRLWDDGRFVTIKQPEAVSTVGPGANPDYDTTTIRYGYSSMVTPPTLFLYDVATDERLLLKQQEVLGEFDSAGYRTDRIEAVGPDGVAVPISLVMRHDRSLTEPGPCVLYAYGSYEAAIDPTFSAIRLSLLDRGFVFAIAHVRGGGELGRRWYDDGKLANKPNTFRDVETAARRLVADGTTTAEQLVLRGGSAGGLMAGAVINQVPELFAGVVAQVPFVDVLTTITNPELPLTVTEWEEWGNPISDELIYRTMRSYSPIDNVTPRPYPSVLATAGLNDTRVSYWEAAKWVQELRRNTTSGKPILLWTDLDAGHGGPSGRYDAWRDEARVLAYVCWVCGLTE